jgi:hypothetical protein
MLIMALPLTEDQGTTISICGIIINKTTKRAAVVVSHAYYYGSRYYLYSAFLILKKNRISHCSVCVCVRERDYLYVSASTTLLETWYVYHGT